MIVVEAHFEGLPELGYTVDVVLGRWLGLAFTRRHVAGAAGVVLRRDGKSLALASTVLTPEHARDARWPMPALPLARFDATRLGCAPALTDPQLPVLFGMPTLAIAADRASIGIDILGSVFFLLSRYEEAFVAARDTFDRFPSAASVAAQADFLGRPLADEYVEVLFAAMRALWPDLQRKTRRFRIAPTCDVDHPYNIARTSLGAMARSVAVAVVRERSARHAVLHMANYATRAAGTGSFAFDGNMRALDWLIEAGQDNGIEPTTFYFKAGASHPRRDRNYRLDEPALENVLRRIHEQGHRIGLHPSFETYKAPARIAEEALTLRETLRRLGIEQPEGIGARQHYLRWATPTTARAYEAAGLTFDSSLSFADQAGFRCGTCHAFPLFDIEERRQLAVEERPLIMMEDSVQHYMGLGRSEGALEAMLRLRAACERVQGTFVMLWHNTNVQSEQDRRSYRALLA